MNLVEIPDNPIPHGAQVLEVAAADKVLLRTVHWLPQGASRGTVTICQGRAEFIEKYFEVVSELLSRGFAVVTFDWRGQGGSARQLRNRAKGHVADFKRFQRDLAAVVRAVLKPFAPTPWYGLGHSMGAAIMLEAAHDGMLPFERMVLTGPMVDFAPALRPRWGRCSPRASSRRGWERPSCPAAVRSAAGDAVQGQSAHLGHRSLRAGESRAGTGAHLAIGAPTVSWVHQAFQLFARFASPGYAEEIRLPTFIVACGREALVDTTATERFAMRMKAARYCVVPESRHEIMVETDALRAQFWAAFDAFMLEPDAEADTTLRGARRDLMSAPGSGGAATP